jgi:hypothetical protein
VATSQGIDALTAALALAPLDRTNTFVTLVDDSRNPMVVRVGASADSPDAAKRATERALTALITANLRAAEQRSATSGVQMRVVNPAGQGTMADRKILRNSTIGGLVGLLATAARMLASRRRVAGES